MGKLEHFVRSRTEQVLGSRQHFAMRPYFDGIIGFLGHYPDLYKVVGGYKDLKKAIAECNKSTA